MTISEWLEQLKKSDYTFEAYKIVIKLYELTRKHLSSTNPVIKYGWIFIDETKKCWWIYVYKNHVNYEFSKEYSMNDEGNNLLWNWKYRRHIQCKSIDDIANMWVEKYIEQMAELYHKKSTE